MTQLHSAKRWAVVTFYLLESLIDRLREKDVLTEKDVQKIRDDAAVKLRTHADQDIREAVQLLEAIYDLTPRQ